MKDFSTRASVVCFLVLTFAVLSVLHAEDNWPQFRGPTGRGHSTTEDIPMKWSADSVVWKTKLKGQGQSSLVNWGDRLFLTSASEDGRERYVFCLDRQNGKIIWERTILCKSPEH
nr:hypothetical protein [bacterium]